MQQALITKRSTPPAVNDLGPLSDLQVLATIEPTDADFLSCYVDLTAGQAACEAWLEQRAEATRADLQGVTRIDFEQALEMVQTAVARIWEDAEDGPAKPAVAIFARGLAGGQSLSVVPLDAPVEPRLLFYRVPDLAPLAIAEHHSEAFTLVLARKDGLQVLDVDGQTVTPKAWASFRDSPKHAARSIVVPQRRFQVLRRALSGASAQPLVVAGDGACLDEVTEALPARATGRLHDVCRMPAHLEQAVVIKRVRQRLLQRRELKDYQLASRLVRAARNNGLAVAGPIPCREALRTGAAEALVLGKQRSSHRVWRCEACHDLTVSAPRPSHCDSCGADPMSRWDTDVELVRLACQQGIAVVYSDAEALSEIGGVGCMLREPVEVAVLETPKVSREALDLVA